MTNYNYSSYQEDVNEFVSIVQKTLNRPEKYGYVNYNIKRYGTVPLWVIIQTLTLGNISKMFMFSKQELQSQVAREFKHIYGNHLSSMLNVLSKFRNVCAHGERLYNYKTKKSIINLPIHSKIKNYNPKSKNDLFNVLICFKYLSKEENFVHFSRGLDSTIKFLTGYFGQVYITAILNGMGFPENWKDVLTLEI